METSRATTRHRRGGSRSAAQVTRAGRANPGPDRVIDAIRRPLVLLDEKLRVIVANRAFYHTFHVSLEETENRLIYELGNGQWNIPALRTALLNVLPEQGVVTDFKVEHEFPHIGRKKFFVNARQMARNTNYIVVTFKEY